MKPGVFVGKVNVKIRNLLWERICQTDAHNGAVMIFDTHTEQGFQMELYGNPKRRVVDFEGIQLIQVAENEENTLKTICREQESG